MNGFFRQCGFGMNRAFKMVIAGEKLAVSARNLVHLARSSNGIAQSSPKAPTQHKNNAPGRYETEGYDKWLNRLNQEMQQSNHNKSTEMRRAMSRQH
jgi:hypothetical protein